jgi:hypothetical protein
MTRGRALIAVCGLAAVALTLPAFLLEPPAPAANAGTASVGAYYQRAGEQFLVFGWLTGLSIPLMLTHVAGVATWLGGRRGLRTLSLLYAVTGTSSHVMQLTLLAVFQTAPFAVAAGDPAGTRLLSEVGDVGFAFYAIAEGARQSVASAAVLGAHAAPRWLGVLTGADAALCLLGSIGALGTGQLAAGGLPVVAWYPGFLLAFTAFNVWLLLPGRRSLGR